jgi:hypothetical protein
MASAETTTNHNEIRTWAEERGGHPAQVKGTGGLLRIDFEEAEPDERLEEISWDDFFAKFDDKQLTFLYAPDGESRFNKLIDGDSK